MSPRPHPRFTKAPLKEAVFDLFVAGSPFKLDGVDAAFRKDLTGFSSPAEPWHSAFAQMAPGPAPGTQATNLILRNGVRYWNEDRTKGVLLAPDVFAFNVLPPYRTFEEIVPQISALHERYLDAAKPTQVLWLGQRYINQVTLSVKGDESPSGLFTLYPRLTRRESAHPFVSVQIEATRFENGIVLANLALSALDMQNAVYTLDLYAKTTSDVPLTPASGITDWHVRAHEEVRATFLWCITKEARARFKEKL